MVFVQHHIWYDMLLQRSLQNEVHVVFPDRTIHRINLPLQFPKLPNYNESDVKTSWKKNEFYSIFLISCSIFCWRSCSSASEKYCSSSIVRRSNNEKQIHSFLSVESFYLIEICHPYFRFHTMNRSNFVLKNNSYIDMVKIKK